MDLSALPIALGIFLIVLTGGSLIRAVLGPSVVDRLLGLNAIGAKTVVLIVVVGLIFERVEMFVDIALAYAMLNFIAVLAASRYMHKRGFGSAAGGYSGAAVGAGSQAPSPRVRPRRTDHVCPDTGCADQNGGGA